MRPRHPLLSACLRALRSAAWTALLTAAAALLVASFVAPQLFERAAREAALSEQRSTQVGDATEAVSDARLTWKGATSPSVGAQLRDRMGDITGYGAASVTGFGAPPNSVREPVIQSGRSVVSATLWTRDGITEVLGAPPRIKDREAVWVSRDTAAELEIGAGSRVELGLRRYSETAPEVTVTATVAGVFDAVPGQPLPAELQALGVTPADLPPNTAIAGESTLVVTTDSGLNNLTRALGDEPTRMAAISMAPDTDVDTALSAEKDLRRLTQELDDPSSALNTSIGAGEGGVSDLQLSTGLPALLTNVEAIASMASAVEQPLFTATRVLAIMALIGSLGLRNRSRNNEVETLASLGVRCREQAGMTVAETLPVLALAVPAGVALGWGTVETWGPPGQLTASESTAQVSLNVAAAAAVIVTCAVAVSLIGGRVAEIRMWRPVSGTSRTWLWTWTAVTSALTAVAATVSLTVIATSPEDRPTAPLSALFPLLVAAAVVSLAARVAYRVQLHILTANSTKRFHSQTSHQGRARWRNTLTMGLARQGRGEAVVVVVSLATVLSLLGYGLAVKHTLDSTRLDKAAVLAGAQARADVGTQLAGRELAQANSVGGPMSAVVWQRSVDIPSSSRPIPILAIAPRDFVEAADWGASLSVEGRAAMEALEAQTGDTVRVVVAGNIDHEVGDRLSVVFDDSTALDVEIADVVPALPGSGIGGADAALYAAASQLFDALPPAIDPRASAPDYSQPGGFEASIWARDTVGNLALRLKAEAIEPEQTVSLGDVLTRPAAMATKWTSRYLNAIGLLIVLIGLGLTGALAHRTVRRDRLTALMLRRMGWTRLHVLGLHVVEVLRTLSVAFGAAALAITVLLHMPSVVDIEPQTAPTAAPQVTWHVVAYWATYSLVLLSTAIVLLATGTRSRQAEVLRGDD